MFYLEARISGQVVRWPLSEGESLLGRGDECDLPVDEGSVSPRHLRLRLAAGRLSIEDLGSANGLWVGGERVARAELGTDEWFAAGTVLLALREGLSLGVGERGEVFRSSLLTRRGGPPIDVDALPAGLPARGESGSLEAMLGQLDRLLSGEDPEDRCRSLLRWLAEQVGGKTVLLFRRGEAGGAWALRGEWGAGVGEALGERALSEALGPGGSKRVGEALVLAGGPRGGDWRLVIDPAPDGPVWLPVARLVLHLLAPDAAAGEPAEARSAGSARGGGHAAPDADEPFLALSELTLRVLRDVDRLAATDLPVMLHGESGTGKELLARRLHRHSPRPGGPFVAINCAALPADLLEAELFGIEQGVATGVSARRGRFQLASGGTLFLDEVADLPPALQPKLLRALESLEITPLGAPSPVSVHVRLVAASHQDLEQRVREGTFRRDLLYRLAGAVVEVPPLRERPEEILPLARRFASQAAGVRGGSFEGIDVRAARQLLNYDWPGNVRELRHVVFRALALADGPILHEDLLPAEVRGAADEGKGEIFLGLGGTYRGARERFERLYFTSLLESCGGNHAEAARRAGLSRSSLYRKLAELGLREGPG
ncbi:MAG: sigma 54-interacting transcriptional regulator [Acidobacteriota bacterium]|nr:sigma 54-interacting transcriptional regulator [Acidobacteriota bacterium]